MTNSLAENENFNDGKGKTLFEVQREELIEEVSKVKPPRVS